MSDRPQNNAARAVLHTTPGSVRRDRSSPDHTIDPRLCNSLSQISRSIPFGAGGPNNRDGINLRTGRVDVVADMAGVFHHTTPHGVEMLGGRGEDHPDDYYYEQRDPNMIRGSPQTPHNSGVGASAGLGSNTGESNNSTLPFIKRSGDKLVFLSLKFMVIDVMDILI